MPTLEVLDTLQGIIEKLVRLSSVERGDPLRASDWNTLVDCIRRIANTLLDREVSGSVPNHDHPDQVSLDWLDPNLKRLMEKGPLHEPESLARLSKLEREIKRLHERWEKNNGQLADMRGTVYDMGTSKVGQEGRLKTLELQIKNLPDARQDVLTLNEKVSGMAEKIDKSLAFEERLDLDGEPFDLAEVKEELEASRQLRQGFTDQDGSLWDAATIRRELTQLQNTLVTQEDLELALQREVTGGPIIDPQIEAFLDTRVGNLVEEHLATGPVGGGPDPAFGDRLSALEETQLKLDTSLEEVTQQLAGTPSQDEFQSVQSRIKDAETQLISSDSAHENLIKSFAQITGFLQDFSKPPIPGARPNTLNINTLRFNVAINNHEALREKLISRQVFTVENLAQLSSSTLNELLGDLVSASEANLIRRNIKSLTQR